MPDGTLSCEVKISLSSDLRKKLAALNAQCDQCWLGFCLEATERW